MKYCSKCGKEIMDGAVFCSNCGNALQIDESKHSYEDKTIEKGADVEKGVKKKGRIAGIILISLGAYLLIIGISTLVGFVNTTVESGAGVFIMGIAFLVYGALLLIKNINKYGWGIAATVTISTLVGAIHPFNKSSFMGSLVLTIIFICLLVKANTKK